MDLDQETQKIREKVGEDCELGGKIKFDLGDDGVILVDASVVPNSVSNDNGDADCTISISADDFIVFTASTKPEPSARLAFGNSVRR